MSKTRLGQGPRYTSNLPNAPDIPVFGVTFIYLDDAGNLKRSYAVIPCTHPSEVGFVVIQYLKKIFNTTRFSTILRSKTKVYVTSKSNYFQNFVEFQLFLQNKTTNSINGIIAFYEIAFSKWCISNQKIRTSKIWGGY